MKFDATDADLALFLEEAAEQLETLSDGLLRMERDASDPQLLQAVFRAAHTLKGSSATIGHARMAVLTHAMESVLDSIRNGSLSPAADGVIDALLAGVDALHVLNEEIVTRTESDIAIDDLIGRLHQAAGGQAASPGAPARSPAMEPVPMITALEDGAEAVEVTVQIDPASSWPAVRAYQVLMELASLGSVVRSQPSEAELQAGES